MRALNEIVVATLFLGTASILPGQSLATRSTPGQVCGLAGVVEVAAGGIGSLALRNDGTVWQWYGQMPPTQVSELSGIVAIAAGLGHNMALKSDGTVWEWTSLSAARFSGAAAQTPRPVTEVNGVVGIAAGESRSLAVTSDGTVWEWTGLPAAQFAGVMAQTPRPVTALNGVVAVSVAVEIWWGELLDARSLALKGDGTVWVWHAWNEGQDVKSGAPVQVGGLTGIVAIAGGIVNDLALKSDGTVWQWNGSSTPVQVSRLSGVLAIAAGATGIGGLGNDAYGLALKSDGTVWSWGNNNHGQLGDGTTAYATSPVQVARIGEVAAIAAAGVYADGVRPVSAAIKRDGTVWEWGETWNAHLGDGTTCNAITRPGTIDTIAGDGTAGSGGDGGPATLAQLSGIAGIAIDSVGSLYIADSFARAIRKVGSDGVASTVIGASGGLIHPIGVAVDAGGNLFIADIIDMWGRGRVVKMTPRGAISTIGDSVFATDGWPTAIVADSVGNVYIGYATLWDKPSAIYKVSPDGMVSTVCLVPTDLAVGLALDSAGNLYISAVSVNSGPSGVWKADPQGRMTQVFESSNTSGVAVDSIGNLFITEKGEKPRIWMVTPDGTTKVVAGAGTKGFSGDSGPATSAQLNDPTSVAVDKLGNILVGDSGNLRIRKVTRGIDYYNIRGMPYNGEDISFWFSFADSVWYSGNKAGEVSLVGAHPPWER